MAREGGGGGKIIKELYSLNTHHARQIHQTEKSIFFFFVQAFEQSQSLWVYFSLVILIEMIGWQLHAEQEMI